MLSLSGLTVSSREAVNYLDAFAQGDEIARASAFEHLLAILLRATDDLHLPENYKYHGGHTTKYDFAVEVLLQELHPYTGMPAEMVTPANRILICIRIWKRIREGAKFKIKDLYPEFFPIRATN